MYSLLLFLDPQTVYCTTQPTHYYYALMYYYWGYPAIVWWFSTAFPQKTHIAKESKEDLCDQSVSDFISCKHLTRNSSSLFLLDS